MTPGTDAPYWAKRLGGHEPMPWYADGRAIGTIGRFWSPAFGDAYQDLQRRPADRYDDDPRIREVVVARCTTERRDITVVPPLWPAVHGPAGMGPC